MCMQHRFPEEFMSNVGLGHINSTIYTIECVLVVAWGNGKGVARVTHNHLPSLSFIHSIWILLVYIGVFYPNVGVNKIKTLKTIGIDNVSHCFDPPVWQGSQNFITCN